LPTVLEFDGQVRYWRNLGNGRFDLMRTMETAPAGLRLGEPGVQLLDANGNGRADLMVTGGLLGGYFPLTFDGQWNKKGFVRYRSAPAVNLDAPNVRLMDLDGDGVTDALRTGTQFELYYNDPAQGWSKLDVRKRTDNDDFPNVTFEDPRVKLGDMTGDGLQDILLVQNGSVEYWPYRGYGRWGRRVVMRNSPRFEDAVLFPGIGFDPKRLLIGDVDGDGVADFVYVSSGRITVWINRDGNSWSDPIVIHGTPPVTDATAVRLADMLGTGTEGILWTYDFGAFPDSSYKFLDLTGGIKPYVLDQMDNHMGAVTKVSYAASTRFYLADDARPETRWRTSLPFPVQVVVRVEVIDQISQGKLTTEYRYHHGYWDGVEREFRGFGMVEHLDTETFADYHAPGAHGPETSFEPVPEKHFSPPLLTRTWFHQGPVDDDTGDWHELDWAADYWPGDPEALGHTDGVNAFLRTLTDPRSRRDALRALRGSALRTELYALDGADRQEQKPQQKHTNRRAEIDHVDRRENAGLAGQIQLAENGQHVSLHAEHGQNQRGSRQAEDHGPEGSALHRGRRERLTKNDQPVQEEDERQRAKQVCREPRRRDDNRACTGQGSGRLARIHGEEGAYERKRGQQEC